MTNPPEPRNADESRSDPQPESDKDLVAIPTSTPDSAARRSTSRVAGSPFGRLQAFVTPLGLLLAALVLFGCYLRLRDFGYPKTLQFDEHHFVETARGYLRHQADWNDHPPLGKLLIAASMHVLGDNSVAFRLPGLISGLLTIVLGAITARRLFPTRWAWLLAAALLAADGFLIAYSRAALLDGFLAMASVAALLLVSFELSWIWGIMAGLVLGFAASVKFSGIGVVLPLLFAVAVAKRGARDKLVTVGAMAVASGALYISSYSLGLSLTDKPNGLFDIIEDTQRLLKHHAELTDMKNPATSGWVTWLLPTRPLMLGFVEKHGAVRALTTLGNLATWWGTVALALLSFTALLRIGWWNALRGRNSADSASEVGTEQRADADVVTAFMLDNGKSVIAAMLTALGFLAPWVMTHRDSYIYHFLPVYVPLVVVFAGFLGWYEVKRPRLVFYFAIVTLLVAAFYAPLWAYVPMSPDALRLRLFITSWR